jgi:hypothetical protein
MGAAVLGCVAAFWFRNFVEQHPLAFLAFAHAYGLLVIFGAYKKYQIIVSSEQGN